MLQTNVSRDIELVSNSHDSLVSRTLRSMSIRSRLHFLSTSIMFSQKYILGKVHFISSRSTVENKFKRISIIVSFPVSSRRKGKELQLVKISRILVKTETSWSEEKFLMSWKFQNIPSILCFSFFLPRRLFFRVFLRKHFFLSLWWFFLILIGIVWVTHESSCFSWKCHSERRKWTSSVVFVVFPSLASRFSTCFPIIVCLS